MPKTSALASSPQGRPRILSLALVCILAGFLAACGDDDDDSDNAPNSGNNPSGGGSGAVVNNPNDMYAAERQACVDRINGFRATLNIAPLQRWTAQEACTDGQAKSDSETNKPHGAFGDCTEHAQDECPGWGSVDSTIKDCLQDMWNEGPGEPYAEHGHFLNMSSTDSKQVACGWYETPDGEVWAVQNFR